MKSALVPTLLVVAGGAAAVYLAFSGFLAGAEARAASGGQIAFVDATPNTSGPYRIVYRLRTVSAAGGRPRPLLSPPGQAFDDFGPNWSADGKMVAFVRSRANTRGTEQVYVVNADGTGLRRVGRGSEAALSPDGRHVALVRPDGVLSVIRLADRRQTRLGRGYGPIWSPDGRRIAFFRALAPRQGENSAVYLADPVRASVRRLAVHAPMPEESTGSGNHPESYSHGSWSHDGRALAFDASWVVNGDPQGYGAVRVVAVDGSGDRSFDYAGMCTWSRAGTRCTRDRPQSENWRGICSWSPTRRELACSVSGIPSTLEILDPETGVSRELIRLDRQSEVRAAWSPGGNRVAHAWSPDGNGLAYTRCWASGYGGCSLGVAARTGGVSRVVVARTRRGVQLAAPTWQPRR